MSKPKEQMVTLPLSRLVWYILGCGYWESKPIHPDDAAVIHAMTKNAYLCHVQFKDQYDDHLDNPVLWDFGHWRQSTEARDRIKRWSDSERVKRNIMDANVKIVGRVLESDLGMRGALVTATAYMILKSSNPVRKCMALGISKLITKEEEIP